MNLTLKVHFSKQLPGFLRRARRAMSTVDVHYARTFLTAAHLKFGADAVVITRLSDRAVWRTHRLPSRQVPLSPGAIHRRRRYGDR